MRPESVLGSGLGSARLTSDRLWKIFTFKSVASSLRKGKARCPLPVSELPFDPQIKRNNFRISNYIVAFRVSLLQLRNLCQRCPCLPGSKCRQHREVKVALRRTMFSMFLDDSLCHGLIPRQINKRS